MLTASIILWGYLLGRFTVIIFFPSVLLVCVVPPYPFVTRKGWEGHFYARELFCTQESGGPLHSTSDDSGDEQQNCIVVEEADQGGFYWMTIMKADAAKLKGVPTHVGNTPENGTTQQHYRSMFKFNFPINNFHDRSNWMR